MAEKGGIPAISLALISPRLLNALIIPMLESQNVIAGEMKSAILC